MRPVPVPQALANLEWVDSTSVLSAPDGDLTNPDIAPIEAIWFQSDLGPSAGVVLVLEDEDLEAIERGARHVLMSFPGRVPVFIEPVVFEISNG